MSRFSEARFMGSVASAAQFPADVGVEIAVAGRSNAGKSSAINAITQRRNLARTSKTPGRTRLLNYFELAPARRLVDLLRLRASLKGVFVVVDARRGLGEGDERLIEWSRGTPLHVLLSKADKL